MDNIHVFLEVYLLYRLLFRESSYCYIGTLDWVLLVRRIGTIRTVPTCAAGSIWVIRIIISRLIETQPICLNGDLKSLDRKQK